MMFRKLGLALSVVLMACASPPAPAVDAAIESDAAVVAPDTGPAICGHVMGGIPTPMVASCMPRCSHATWTAYQACRDTTCVAAALSADTTYPVVNVAVGATQIIPFGCGLPPGGWSCLQWQTFALAAEICPAQADTWASCQSSCDAQVSALFSCAQADATFNSRYLALAQMCFAAE